jgi:Family of unknown function (DUF5681)
MPNPRGQGGFKKGESGNPGGRPGEKLFRAALLAEIAKGGNNQMALRKVARALLNKGCSGDVSAIRELANRLDGPPEATSDFSVSAGTGTEDEISIKVSFVQPPRYTEDEERGGRHRVNGVRPFRCLV